MEIEELIQAVVRGLGAGATEEQIRQAALDKGWASEQVYLALKAGQNLYDAIAQQEEELAQRPAPFGRK